MRVRGTQAIGEITGWARTDRAQRWLRNDDRRTRRPPGRVQYGNNRVQEIVSGTPITTVEIMKSPSTIYPLSVQTTISASAERGERFVIRVAL